MDDEFHGRLRETSIIEIRKGTHFYKTDTRGRGGNSRVTTEIKLPLPTEIDFNIVTVGTLLKRTSRSEKRSLNHFDIVNWLQLPEMIHDAACGGPFYSVADSFWLPYAFTSVTVESAVVTISPKGVSPFIKIEFKSFIPDGADHRQEECTCFANQPVFGGNDWRGNDEYPHRYLVPMEELEKRRIDHREFWALECKDEAAQLRWHERCQQRLDLLLTNGQARILQ